MERMLHFGAVGATRNKRTNVTNLGAVDESAPNNSNPNLLDPRQVKLTTRTGIEINRLLPHKSIRRIGPFVFFDHFGPTTQETLMQVGAHPHTGLQTVSWLFSGKVLHHDSVGSKQLIEPTQLNLMTAGHGVSHSEMSLDTGSNLHGIQLWTALPFDARNIAPAFEHFAQLPMFQNETYEAQVILGSFQGASSPATIFSPLLAVELHLMQSTTLHLTRGFEHGVFPVDSDLLLNNQHVPQNHLLYLDDSIGEVTITTEKPTTVVLIGGAPFNEPIVMWWNFIARSHEEIVQMQAEWNSHSPRFGEFMDEINHRIPAPPMPAVALKAR